MTSKVLFLKSEENKNVVSIRFHFPYFMLLLLLKHHAAYFFCHMRFLLNIRSLYDTNIAAEKLETLLSEKVLTIKRSKTPLVDEHAFPLMGFAVA